MPQVLKDSKQKLNMKKAQIMGKSKRPFGVNAIIFLLALLVLNSGVDVIRALNGQAPYTFPDAGAVFILIASGVAVVFCAVLAVGLWKMRGWAWYAAMMGSGLSLFFAIWRHFYGGQPYVAMFLFVVIVLYLNQREVKAVFPDKPEVQP